MPSINGSGEIAARFEAIEEQIRSRALDEFSEMRPGGPESQRVSLEDAELKDDYRQDFIEDQKRELNLESAIFDQRRAEQNLQDERVVARQQEVQRNDLIAGEERVQQRVTEEDVVSAKNYQTPIVTEPGAPVNTRGEPLSSEEQREVQRLERRDLEVKTNQRAYVRDGGSYARGGTKLSNSTGSDGNRYATDVQVDRDLSSESASEATASMMPQVQRAGLAPANPSGTDRATDSIVDRRDQGAQAEIQEFRSA